MIELVINGVYILAIISAMIFFILLAKIIYDKVEDYRNEKLIAELKNKINHYLSGGKVDISPQISAKKKRLLEGILINYSKQVRGETKKQLQELAEKTGVIDFKVQHLVNSNQWWKKSEAAYMLGELGSDRAIDALLDFLEAENSDIRYQSALAIVKISGSEYLELAITKLLELDVYPRDTILRLIEEVDEEIYEKMQPLLRAEEIEKRIIALRSLGLKQDFRLLQWIKEYLKSEDEDLVKACLQAAYQLGDIGDDSYFQLLLTTKNNSSFQVRANLAQVLEKFRTEQSRLELQELMTDSHWKVRYTAAESLLKHGEKGVLALSQQLHSSDQFAQDMAWQILHQEITFDSLLNNEELDNYQQLIDNISQYLEMTNKEGVKCELEDYLN
ncbi:HEAT repeat domain-containing protein [Halanaerobacter jeridensis]|uniref:HEAT repeat protein n=1 Tax=Halanaerobacter jeridensis TaxID=706427 RepID=A0A938XNM4_9FIRM|nr:HEAT repeat domain-containing protein [Halanaerobacter jeridensis]MBM7555672.1 HEAT repeat protein [Halanaerobacter jeridensis]